MNGDAQLFAHLADGGGFLRFADFHRAAGEAYFQRRGDVRASADAEPPTVIAPAGDDDAMNAAVGLAGTRHRGNAE